jgi:hypothetical protein
MMFLDAIPTMPYEVSADCAATEAMAFGDIEIVPFLGAQTFYGKIAPALAR